MGKKSEYIPQFTAEESEEVISDSLREEYERFLNHPESLSYVEVPSSHYDKSYDQKPNGVSTVLTLIGIIIYASGFIAGMVMGDLFSEFNVVIMLVMWVSAFISGTIFIGFSEVIKLLQQISDKLK